jgi:hypothetical protein
MVFKIHCTASEMLGLRPESPDRSLPDSSTSRLNPHADELESLADVTASYLSFDTEQSQQTLSESDSDCIDTVTGTATDCSHCTHWQTVAVTATE